MTPARTARHDARRASIIATARAALVHDGLERFAMRDIAARSGMTLGNLQYYFATRADLLEAVARSDFERDLVALGAPAGTEPSVALHDAAHQLLRNWADGGSSIWLAVWTLAIHEDRFRALSAEVYGRFYAAVAAVARQIDGTATEAEIAARARLITAVMDGVALQFHTALADQPRRRTELARRAVATVGAIAAGDGSP